MLDTLTSAIKDRHNDYYVRMSALPAIFSLKTRKKFSVTFYGIQNLGIKACWNVAGTLIYESTVIGGPLLCTSENFYPAILNRINRSTLDTRSTILSNHRARSEEVARELSCLIGPHASIRTDFVNRLLLDRRQRLERAAIVELFHLFCPTT